MKCPKLSRLHLYLSVRILLGVLLLAIDLIAAGPAFAGQNRWTPFGPGGGVIVSLALDPAEPEVLYAATERGGLYKSTDAGESWNWSASGMAGEVLGRVVVDPADPEILYAATANPSPGPEIETVYRSADGGAHWSPAFSMRLFATELLYVAAGPGVVYVANPRELFRSTDGGANWTRVFTAGVLLDVAADPTDPENAYLSTPIGVLRAEDGGEIWSLLGPEGPGGPLHVEAVVVSPSHPRTIYAQTEDTVFRSENGGSTWVEGAPNPSRSIRLFADPAVPSTVYAAGTGVFVSRDGGASWSPISRGLPRAIPEEPLIVLSLAIRPERPSTLYAGTAGEGIYKTENARLWRPTAQNGLSARPFGWVKAHPAAPGTLYARSALGVHRSTNGGVTWQPFGAELAPSAGNIRNLVLTADPRLLYAATFDGLFRSADGGATWSRIGPSQQTYGAVVVNPRILVVATANGIRRTTDGGRTWTEVLDRSVPIPDHPHYNSRIIEWIRNDPAAPGTIFALAHDFIIHGGGDSYLVKSTDGGVTWHLLPFSDATAIFPGPPRILYGYDAVLRRVVRSRDGGERWQAVGALAGVSDLVVDPRNPNTVYAATFTQGVFRSTNGGVTWSPVNAGLARLGRRTILDLAVHPAVPGLVYAVPFEGGLFQARFTDAN